MLERLARRLVDGVVTDRRQEHRAQLANRQAARERLAQLLREAAAPPPRNAAPTRPTRGSEGAPARARRSDEARPSACVKGGSSERRGWRWRWPRSDGAPCCRRSGPRGSPPWRLRGGRACRLDQPRTARGTVSAERFTYGDDPSQWADLLPPRVTSPRRRRGRSTAASGRRQYDASLGAPLAADLAGARLDRLEPGVPPGRQRRRSARRPSTTSPPASTGWPTSRPRPRHRRHPGPLRRRAPRRPGRPPAARFARWARRGSRSPAVVSPGRRARPRRAADDGPRGRRRRGVRSGPPPGPAVRRGRPAAADPARRAGAVRARAAATTTCRSRSPTDYVRARTRGRGADAELVAVEGDHFVRHRRRPRPAWAHGRPPRRLLGRGVQAAT